MEVIKDQDVYLCGHEHKPCVKGISLTPQNCKHFFQHQAGAMYYDKSGWAQYSFNEIMVAVNGSECSVYITCHYCFKNPAEEQVWVSMCIEKPYTHNFNLLERPATTDAVQGEREERAENTFDNLLVVSNSWKKEIDRWRDTPGWLASHRTDSKGENHER